MRIGRFAPTPSGPLHAGSMLAAIGSWLDASCSGVWLLRIDDLDSPRCRAEHEHSILATLSAFSLVYPQPLLHQSTRRTAYEDAITRLGARLRLFHCDCSRRDLATGAEPCCVRDCRNARRDPQNSALRADLSQLASMRIVDRSLGEIWFDPTVLRDVVIRRRDGIPAYHLACVVDDAFQGVTDVVRGADLLPSTAWQLALHQALDLRPPQYLHLPLVVEADGSKLAKSRHSMPVEAAQATKVTRKVLRWLKQEDPPAELQSVAGLLDFAKAHWDPRRFKGVREVPVTD